ncbi:MAG: TFIIB-type zinc ribbon-containing protein [Salinibacterium sp.]|nr:TFIIB-type zinc ribbon-containing protein [Salinibacterium sp.]MBF0672557.1 TFIIB-type zinc ribbon-containing protein [Salinibacterium sp.]
MTQLAAGDDAVPATSDAPKVVQTDLGAKDGLTKCQRCGSTEIALNVATGMLRCAFCRHEQSSENAHEAFDLRGDIGDLAGLVVGSGSSDISESTEVVLTFKCSACGAEVVVDTAHSTQARCHWCRNTLSVNAQMPNGAVPDMILPFSVTKEEAMRHIDEFVKKRTFFAHPAFKREFNASNVMGVYLPYMVVDVNAHALLTGQGEHETARRTTGEGKDERTVYDADLFDVEREFDIHIDDLTIESSSERLDQRTGHNTNNIINSIMPFDVENAVRYDSNFLSDFTSERRDSNVEQLGPAVLEQAKDIARHRAIDTLAHYDRGVRWDNEDIEIKGQRWLAAYLPVWLYSHYEQKGGGRSLLHYVAVNGRTGETMGSVPLHKGRVALGAVVAQVIGTAASIGLMVTMS